MVVILRNKLFCLLMLMISFHGFSQRHVFSEVSINRSKVYVGEPVEVSVGIYTSTWFTQGVNFGNIKVNGAFTVFFRSVSSSKQINGKNYAGVVAIYNVFPYNNKDLVFPSLEFSVETPNEGDSKGVKQLVKTKSRNISVKPVPNNFDRDEWLVSSSLRVNESWKGDLKNVKVGNVVERYIFRRAYGTVSELIPPIKWDSIEDVSMYPTRADINSEKSKTSISASRSEGIRYLFEKEGSVTLPEITITWWNPTQNKLFKRTLKEKTLEVMPNDDLGMLESVRDSLDLYNQKTSEDISEVEEFKIFGLSVKDFLMNLAIIMGLTYLIYRFLKWILISKGLVQKWKQKRLDYLQSERYYFNTFLKQVSKKDKKAAVNSLYLWIDHLHLKEPTLTYFALHYGSEEFAELVRQSDQKKPFDALLNLESIKMARKKYLSDHNQILVKQPNNWINP